MAFRVVCVCTGNLCRSPIAEALLRRHLERARVDSVVVSAGLVTADVPADATALKVAAESGLDLSAHRSRRIDRAFLEGADLVVGMAREHVREVAALAPAAWPRTFTLRELGRRTRQAGSRPPDVAVEEWIASLSQGRVPGDFMGESPADDIPDPIGRPPEEFRVLTRELDDRVSAVVRSLFPPGPASATR